MSEPTSGKGTTPPPAKRRKRSASVTPSPSSSAASGRATVRVVGDSGSSKKSMAELWKTGALTDVRVVAGERTFAAHRLVLASASDYMRALFCEDRFADSTEALIELADMSASSFKCVLDWAYLDRCDVADDASELMEVLEAASRLQCTGLIDRLVEAIAERVAPDTCLAVWDAAERMGLSSLAEAAKAKALSSFRALSRSDDFRELSADKLAELVSSNLLSAPREEDVFSVVVDWAKAQPRPIASDELEKVMRHVRFPLMSGEFVDDHVEAEPLLIDNPKCMVSVQRSFKERLYGRKTDRTTPRQSGTLKWSDLDRSVDLFRIRVKHDVDLVKRLCERKVPGAAWTAGWNDPKAQYCGKEFTLKPSEIEKVVKRRCLLLNCWYFPIDALEWI